ncbi:MAG TPA: class I SAM-dependent methyltransferase [Acidimicrobiales bacterium]|nr:class I SAM-dependent methyltransferase [Acidimicrobiales bacterium]
MDPRTDKSTLVNCQYATGANLSARANIYGWQKPTFDFVGWVLDQHRWQIGARVLDLGCGYGAYVPQLRARGAEVIAVDLSMGMLAEARAKGAPLACADAQSLALRSGAFDVAIAPHMLYHVPDVPSAVRELRRVVRPGGTVLAVTNALDDKPQIIDLLHRAAGRAPGAYAKVDRRFVLEDAPGLLRAEFDDLRVVEVRTEFRIGEVEPLVRYLDSIRSAAEPALGVDWNDLLTEAARLIAQEIRSTGGFLVTTHAGVVVAE